MGSNEDRSAVVAAVTASVKKVADSSSAESKAFARAFNKAFVATGKANPAGAEGLKAESLKVSEDVEIAVVAAAKAEVPAGPTDEGSISTQASTGAEKKSEKKS